MRVALVCDPTAPYLAVPMLTGFLRSHGVDVVPIDANVEAWDDLLEPNALASVRGKLEARLGQLDARASLRHQEQIEYAALVGARWYRRRHSLRDEARFFDADQYASAVAIIEAALRAISAGHIIRSIWTSRRIERRSV